MSQNSQNPGIAYAALWAECIAMLRVHTQDWKNLAHKERKVLQEDSAVLRQDFPNERLEDYAESIVFRLIRLAEVRFSPSPASKLTIEERPYLEKYLKPIRRSCIAEEFDPASLWNDLESQYGGTQGEDTAYSQAAKGLVSFFNLRAGKDVRQKSGRVILDVRVFTERPGFSAEETRRLGYHTVERFRDATPHLLSFADWAGESELTEALPDFLERFNSWSGCTVNSREKFALPGIDVVTYNTRFEFRLQSALAQKLQLFVSTYAADLLADRAA